MSVAPDFGVDRAQGDEIARMLGLRRRRPRRRPQAAGRRYSVAPLLVGRTVVELARLADVERSTVQRWCAGGVDEFTADELAVAVGRHPAEVWPEW